uniref:Uncharacterized protein n=1 Tax=Anopheles coluzzii TaxID=1518534 RepID=A0A8W7PLC8_ANOCL
MTDLSRHHHHQGNGFGSGSSIHDYPEHLNPFYEDENHKRLRFLEHKPAPKSQRRGSLSSLRDGLRELWQFSSIRFGKKRSSTLGINKTSESPPPLRRDTYDVDSFASTSGYRNTVNAPGYGTTRESQSYTTTPLSYSSTLRSRTSGTRTRTKRRAPPPPPVAITPANRVVPSPEASSVVDEAQNEDLRNLTAEIESFVRISSSNVDTSTKDTSTVRSDAIVETREIKPHDLNNNSAQAEIPTTVSTIECEIVQNKRTVQDVDFENLALPETPVPTRRTNRENREKYITQDVTTIHKTSYEKPTVAPKAALPSTTEEVDDDECPTTTIIVDNLRYKHKVAPIHTEISTKIENARMKISESTGNLPTIANESGNNDRRRSVRDIIESINKSQSMLKVNHDQSTNGLHETQSTDSMARNIRELNEREREIQNLLQDIDTRYGTHSAKGDSTLSEVATASELPMLSDGRGSYYDNLTDDNLNDNLDDKNNAASGFRVKKSPTKTVLIAEGGDDQQFQDCINWNPLPKPRRSHILTENGADSQQEATISNPPS